MIYFQTADSQMRYKSVFINIKLNKTAISGGLSNFDFLSL